MCRSRFLSFGVRICSHFLIIDESRFVRHNEGNKLFGKLVEDRGMGSNDREMGRLNVRSVNYRGAVKGGGLKL